MRRASRGVRTPRAALEDFDCSGALAALQAAEQALADAEADLADAEQALEDLMDQIGDELDALMGARDPQSPGDPGGA